MKDTEQKGKRAAKKSKSKKGSSNLVLTVEKVVVSEPLPALVQATINVKPSGKIVAEKPRDAAEKAAQEAEDSRLAERERAAEAEKVARVVALADRTRKRKEAVELANKLAGEREILAKAKADARLAECAAQVESEEGSGNVEATGVAEDAEEIPLSRSNRKKVAANRSLNKKDFYIARSTELEDTIPEEEDLVDDNDMMDMSAEGNLDTPVIEELSEDSEPEAENP
ncbi:hypothetical protein M5689_013064 [Euphorbia peplus]|nr:hypothetical protein M5689_013064 [Euphorbia peplus]